MYIVTVQQSEKLEFMRKRYAAKEKNTLFLMDSEVCKRLLKLKYEGRC